MKIEGSNAVITGSSRGIGRAVALHLAERGANVVICCRSRVEEAEEVKELAEKAGVRALVVQADLGTVEGAESVVDRCVEDLGGVDVLVNNAGLFELYPIHELRPEDLDRILRVNLMSYFHTSRKAVADMMRRGRGGCIVNISSIVSMIGMAGGTAYAASKGGVTGLTVCLAREVARYGIRVNAIAPGYIETEMIGFMSEEYRAKVMSRIPMRRFGTGEEVAKTVAFLVEDATYMTGQTLVLDGGIMID